mmetsp:Transcript_10094/g.41875  ORF Transcript_10094/g.41875 Transcript_10094/m.41875 type:complete len:256 (+) Transcript_10094:644-1411(+)
MLVDGRQGRTQSLGALAVRVLCIAFGALRQQRPAAEVALEDHGLGVHKSIREGVQLRLAVPATLANQVGVRELLVELRGDLGAQPVQFEPHHVCKVAVVERDPLEDAVLGRLFVLSRGVALFVALGACGTRRGGLARLFCRDTRALEHLGLGGGCRGGRRVGDLLRQPLLGVLPHLAHDELVVLQLLQRAAHQLLPELEVGGQLDLLDPHPPRERRQHDDHHPSGVVLLRTARGVGHGPRIERARRGEHQLLVVR